MRKKEDSQKIRLVNARVRREAPSLKKERSSSFVGVVEEIRKIKEKHQLSNETLAVKIGIGIFTVHRMLHDVIHAPHYGTLRLLQNFIKNYKEDKDFLGRR